MKKLLLTVSALALAFTLAEAADLTPFTGPQDPSQINANLNRLENNIQSGVNGLIGSVNGSVSSTATTVEQTLASLSIPANTLRKAGQGIRVRCSGYSATVTTAIDTKIIKIYYGTTAFTSPGFNNSAMAWDGDLVVQYNASSTDARWVGRGSLGTGTVSTAAVGWATQASTNTVDAMTAAQTAKCTVTQNTASAADTIMTNFYVEQIK